ncbi:MAG: choice-of-anchor Q domain-containing protein [Candidatus Woesearchaeota archaeon]
MFKNRHLKKNSYFFMLLTLMLVCGLIVLPPVIATVYIDPTYIGDNGPEDGSIARPFNSWTDFTIQDGETYLQKRGTIATINEISYKSNNLIGAYGVGLRPIINSSSSSYTIAPTGDYEGNVTIRDIEINNNVRNSASIRFLRNFTNVTVDNCVLHGGGAGISASYGNNTFFPKNITFINNIVYNVSEDGFFIQGITDFSNISNNYMYEINRDWFEEGQTETQAPGDGVHIIGSNVSSGFFYISNNTIDRTDTANKFCIITVGFHFSAIVERNVCYANPFLVEQTPVQGYYLSDLSDENYIIFRYNTCFNCSTGVITYVRNLTMHNNIFIDSGTGVNAVNNYDSGNVRAYNNVFYNSGSADFGWWQSYVTLYNNIFYNNVSGHSELSGNGDHLVASDYNLFNTAFSTGFDSNSIQADPLFVNPTIYDFSLQSNSPAVNNGTNVGLTRDIIGTLVPQGSAPDIGAYEYIQSNNTPETGNLTVNYALGGTAIGNSSDFELPSTLDINATPLENYTFVNWSIISGDCEITDVNQENTTVTINSGWCYVNANFENDALLNCMNITTANNYYSLSSNVTIPSSTCFNISSSNVTLDCNGFSITGTNSSGTYGIYVTQPNVTIRNCNINNFSSGIFLTNTVSNGVLYNNVINQSFNSSCSMINGSCFGICLNGADYNRIFNNTVYLGRTLFGGGIGVYVSANYNNISNNTIRGGYYNIYIHSSTGNYLINNSLYHSWYDGMYIQSTAYTNVLLNNYILNSTGMGIEFIGNYNMTVMNNIIINSTQYGIRIHNSLNNVNRSDNISNNNIFNSGFSALIISNSNYIIFDNNNISNSNSNNERGVWIANGSYNSIDGNYIQTLYAGLIRGALMINLSSNYNNITSNIINSSATGSSEARGILLDGGSNNNIINNTIFVSSSSNTASVYVGNISEKNIFCLNNFTDNTYYFVDDTNTTNYYNCTYGGKNQGNIWYNIIDGSVDITGNVTSSISGLYLGDYGSGYPYNSINSLNKISSGVIDYSPLTPYITTGPGGSNLTGNLTVNYSVGGLAIGNSSNFELPAILNINATPNEYYTFNNWTNIGNCTITNSSKENTTATINSGWCYIQANFVSRNLGQLATVYIDPTYTDVNGLSNGSIEKPYVSWNNFSLASNRVYLQKRNTMFTSNLSFGLVVTGVNNVTLGAYGEGSRPIFNSTSLNDSARAITFSGGSHNTIRDFEVTSETGTIVVPVHLGYGGTNLTINNCKLHNAQWGIRVGYSGTSNISILNSEIYNIRDDGIYVDGMTGYLLIDNNSIHNVNQNWYYVGTSDNQASGDGIQLNVVRNLTFNVINNIIDRTDTGNKFCFIVGTNTTLYYYNGTYENNTCYVDRNINGGDDINCVYLHAANNSNENRTVIARNNLFHGCNYGIYSYSNDLRLYHNRFINVTTGVYTISGYNTLAYNNLFYNNIVNDMGWLSTSPNMRLLNNIFYSDNISHVNLNGGVIPLVSDYNLFYPRATTYWSGRDDNSLFNTNPLFVNSSLGNFTLQNNSLAIDAGIDVGLTKDILGILIPQGYAPDIGIYEYVQSNYSENSTLFGNLTVNYSVGGIAISNDSNFVLPSTLDINATPLANYTFGNWSVISGDCEINNFTQENTTVTITSGWCYVEAIFEQIELIEENITNTAPIINAQAFSIAEDAVEDDYIGTVVANDSDENQTITYTITSGNTNNAFKINFTTGQLYVNNDDELNFENIRNYTLLITVQDDYIIPESTSNNITIQITDVNEGGGGGGGGGGGNNNYNDNTTIVVLNETNNSSQQNNSISNNFLSDTSDTDNLTIEQQIEEPKSLTDNIQNNDANTNKLIDFSSMKTKISIGVIMLALIVIIFASLFYSKHNRNNSRINTDTNIHANTNTNTYNPNMQTRVAVNNLPNTGSVVAISPYYNDVVLYVNTNLKKGIPMNTIITELRNSGWSEKDIFRIVSYTHFNNK